MKKLSSVIFAAIMLAVVAACGCKCVSPATAASAPAPEKQINVALFLDKGASGVGVFNWAMLMDTAPGVKLHLLSAKDVREGKLAGMNALIMPGGYPGTQFKALQNKGVEMLRKFVADGGGYIGSCAGLANTLNNNGRLRLLPFRRRPNSGGHWATLQVEINQRGAEILNVKPGKLYVRYAGGPIPMPGRKVHEVSTGEVLVVYKNTVSYFGKPEGNFFDQGAVIYGSYGKGKVIATGFHPECWRSTYGVAMGCLYAVTGVKTYPVTPVKNLRPLRVAYYCGGRDTISNVEAMLRLYKDPRIDITIIAAQNINEGQLDHFDMVVFPDAAENACRTLVTNEFQRNEVDTFIKRGGKVIAAGRGRSCLSDPAKALLLKDNDDITPEVLIKNQ